MGIVIRESIYTTMITYVGIAIGTVNALFLYTAFLSPDELGLVRLLPEMAIIFALLAQAGAPYILARFYPLFDAQSKHPQTVVIFSFFVGVFGFLLLGLAFSLYTDFFLAPYANRSKQIQDYSWSIVPLALFVFLFGFAESLLRTQFKITLASFLREVFLKVLNSCIVIAFGLGYISLPVFIAGFVCSYACAFSILLWAVWVHGGLLPVKWGTLQSDDRKAMLLYGLGCIFSGLGSAFITKLDLMMLPAFTDLSQTGVYTIAIFFTTVMEVPKKSLNQIALPIFIKADAASNADEIRGLYQKTSFLGFFTTASLLLLVWVNLDSIFAIMPKGAYYQSGSIVILLLGAAKVVDASGGIGLEMMSFSKHFRFLIIAIFAVGIFAAIGNYLLIPSYGIHGAAIASLVVYSVFLLVRTLYIYRHYSILPFSKSMLLSLVPLSIAFLVSYILVLLTSNFHPLLRLAAHSLVAFSILLGGVYVLRISPEINAIADKAVAILKSKRIS